MGATSASRGYFKESSQLSGLSVGEGSYFLNFLLREWRRDWRPEKLSRSVHSS